MHDKNTKMLYCSNNADYYCKTIPSDFLTYFQKNIGRVGPIRGIEEAMKRNHRNSQLAMND